MVASLHASYGMGDDLVYLGAGEDLLREIAMNGQLRARVEWHLRELEIRAEDLVRKNREAILAVAECLVIRRYVGGAEIMDIMKGVGNATSGKPN